MRSIYFQTLAIITIFLLPVGVFAEGISTPANCVIVSLLKVGSRGTEVECLQEKVGAKTDGIFGPLTRTAVVSFQFKSGLMTDGIVGPLSRAVLNNNVYSTDGVNNQTTNAGTNPSVAPDKRNNTGSLAQQTNTGTSNKSDPDTDKFISIVTEVGRKKGLSEDELITIADSLRKELSAKDYNKEFEQMLIRGAAAHSNTSLFNKVTAKILRTLVSPAYAAAGLPFGGARVGAFYCAVSSNWMIGLTPLPPSNVALLSYTPGTQRFASSNIPLATYMLGTYSPPGVCSYGYVNVPTEGTILPMTGSSPG